MYSKHDLTPVTIFVTRELRLVTHAFIRSDKVYLGSFGTVTAPSNPRSEGAATSPLTSSQDPSPFHKSRKQGVLIQLYAAR